MILQPVYIKVLALNTNTLTMRLSMIAQKDAPYLNLVVMCKTIYSRGVIICRYEKRAQKKLL